MESSSTFRVGLVDTPSRLDGGNLVETGCKFMRKSRSLSFALVERIFDSKTLILLLLLTTGHRMVQHVALLAAGLTPVLSII